MGAGAACLPGVHALHEDLVLFALHHVVGEHGVKVGDGGGQHDAVGAELMIASLQEKSCCYRGNCNQHSQMLSHVIPQDQKVAGSRPEERTSAGGAAGASEGPCSYTSLVPVGGGVKGKHPDTS